VFRPLPIGLKPFEGTTDRFITHPALRHALLRAHVSRQGQRPHSSGFAIEAWRLMQDMLEAVTGSGVQHGLDGLRPRRLLRQVFHALRIKGVDDITDGLDGTSYKLRNGLRRQPTGTGEDDLGTADTEGVRRAPLGLQLETLIIGQESDKYE
jgi:hypothetical protein